MSNVYFKSKETCTGVIPLLHHNVLVKPIEQKFKCYRQSCHRWMHVIVHYGMVTHHQALRHVTTPWNIAIHYGPS